MTEPIASDGPSAEWALPRTELRHPASHGLHELDTLSILRLLNAEDRVAVDVVAGVLPALAGLVDSAAEAVRRGGHVHYFGAGTSGRLGVLDAAEVVPTFGTDPDLLQARIAGGEAALIHAVEDSEDSDAEGREAALSAIRDGDVVIGLTVSGTTPYVRGALEAGRDLGAVTALFTSNPTSPLAELADHVVTVDTGPEILTGSTRLKAGTATKILLNGFSTTLMVRLGRTYSNLMVSVLATNRKLHERTLRILAEVRNAGEAENALLIAEADGDLRVAVVSAVASVPVAEARAALTQTGGSVPDAIRSLIADV